MDNIRTFNHALNNRINYRSFDAGADECIKDLANYTLKLNRNTQLFVSEENVNDFIPVEDFEEMIEGLNDCFKNVQGLTARRNIDMFNIKLK